MVAIIVVFGLGVFVGARFHVQIQAAYDPIETWVKDLLGK